MRLVPPTFTARNIDMYTVIENKLNTSGTARNWNTLQKLLETGRALEGAARGRQPTA